MPTLLSINPEIMDSMLQQCGLSLVRRDVSFQNMNSWHTFIAEYHVDIEVTTFLLLNKRHYFIRIGLWDKQQNPLKLPLTCWREKIFAHKL